MPTQLARITLDDPPNPERTKFPSGSMYEISVGLANLKDVGLANPGADDVSTDAMELGWLMSVMSRTTS